MSSSMSYAESVWKKPERGMMCSVNIKFRRILSVFAYNLEMKVWRGEALKKLC